MRTELGRMPHIYLLIFDVFPQNARRMAGGATKKTYRFFLAPPGGGPALCTPGGASTPQRAREEHYFVQNVDYGMTIGTWDQEWR
jgi:hypothetical protein